MLFVLCSILLFSVIQVQCVDATVSYYDSYCTEEHLWDPTKMYFCQYFEKSHALVKKPFPTASECNTCKAFMSRIEWNEHTEKAVENLLTYSAKHFCENIRKTDKFECKQALSKYWPQIKTLITKMMKSGNFCEVLLKCQEEFGHTFSYYFSDFHHESVTSYPMQFFEYFFNLENYSNDFYPYYFFNYFFKSQEHEFVPYSYFHHFYTNQTVDTDSMVYKFFDYFYKDHKTDSVMHPFSFFEYFFKDHPTDQEWHPMKFFEYFFKDHKINPEWHPATFFEYFYKDHPQSADHDWHPMNVFEYFFNSTMGVDSIPYKFFEYYFSHHPEAKDSFFYKYFQYFFSHNKADTEWHPASFFEYFYKDHPTDQEWHPMEFIEHFFENMPVHHSFYPYQWFDYFFTNQTKWDHYNPFFYYDFFSRDSNHNEPFCTRCEKTPDSKFQRWAQNIDLGKMKEVGYRMFCRDSNKFLMCHSKIDEIVTYVKNALMDVITKTTVCHTIFRCPIQSRNSLFNENFYSFFDHFDVKSSEKQCDVCKSVSEIFYHEFKSDKFINFVKTEFKNGYCDEIFPKNENECEQFLANHLQSVVSKLQNVLESHSLCTPSCKGLKVEDHPWEFYDFFYKSDSKSCPVCKVISVLLKLSIRSDEFKDIVYRKFENTKCKEIFSTIPPCAKFLESEYKPIVRNMTKMLDKDNLCKSICPGSTDAIVPMTYFDEKPETPCEVCGDVIEELEDLKPKLLTIDLDLELICSKFHNKKREDCQRLINQYRSQIKTLVLAKKSKDEVCQTIKQCSSNSMFVGFFDRYFKYL